VRAVGEGIPDADGVPGKAFVTTGLFLMTEFKNKSYVYQMKCSIKRISLYKYYIGFQLKYVITVFHCNTFVHSILASGFSQQLIALLDRFPSVTISDFRIWRAAARYYAVVGDLKRVSSFFTVAKAHGLCMP
jgi:hypothetical protein